MDKLRNEIKLLSVISCAIANSDFKLLEKKILEFKSKQHSPVKLYECILQSYLFCGFPAAIESFKIFKNHFKRFASKKTDYDVSAFRSAGKRNCKLIYKKNYKKLIENMDLFSPDLKDWMIIEGYGKVLNRKGLSLLEREYINVSILVAGYYENQLHSHLKGCLNVGAQKDDLIELINNLKSTIGKSNSDKTHQLINQLSA